MLDVAAVRDQARWMANQRLLDVCMVEVDNPDADKPIRDPETGEVTYPDARLTIYGPDIGPHHGACRVRIANASASVIQGPDGPVALTLAALTVPADVTLPKGADITILASDNPSAVGVRRTVRAVHPGSQQSTNRYGFEELN